MRGSSLTTFLMFLPLIAIPLLAIFGVPEFSPVNASSPTESHRQGMPVTALDAVASTPKGNRSRNDIFDPIESSTNQKPATPAAASDPFAEPTTRKGLGEWEMPPPRQQQSEKSASVQPPLPPQPDLKRNRSQTPTDDAVAMSWRTARQRLDRLGISDFVLQSGATRDQFHFSCFCPSPDNPRVTRRFEAENSDPLQAVYDVLRQIESRQ